MINTTQKGLDLLDVLLRGRAHPRESHRSHRHPLLAVKLGVQYHRLLYTPCLYGSPPSPRSPTAGAWAGRMALGVWQEAETSKRRSAPGSPASWRRQPLEEASWQMEERRRQRRGEERQPSSSAKQESRMATSSHLVGSWGCWALSWASEAELALLPAF